MSCPYIYRMWNRIIDMITDYCAGDVDWTVSEETVAPRGWAIIDALSPETVYEMRVVARSAVGAVESASFIQRVRIGLKRGRHTSAGPHSFQYLNCLKYGSCNYCCCFVQCPMSNQFQPKNSTSLSIRLSLCACHIN